MAKPVHPTTLFRLHYSDGSTVDVEAASAADARKSGHVPGLLITKCKTLKEHAQ
ncbi:hypothetical protein GN325_20760 [Agrobacterium vitis]|uniref:hypothetical protein n=1 Tax=Agrobacterium vitis TaxID=373 RepID=UPI0012E7E84C|nr:hypothetical protein [Agrobacterium vitis]MVB04199.1 hypothetical protein [Agrobacterium vitis]